MGLGDVNVVVDGLVKFATGMFDIAPPLLRTLPHRCHTCNQGTWGEATDQNRYRRGVVNLQ